MELMATLALLAILVGFAIPAYNGYSDRARVNGAIAEIGRVTLELHAWRTNNGGAFPDTLAAAGIAMDPDPWGRAYVYEDVATAGGGVLRTFGGVVVNTEFDLYSLGADGASAVSLNDATSQDDIVLVRDGAFLGLAEEL